MCVRSGKGRLDGITLQQCEDHAKSVQSVRTIIIHVLKKIDKFIKKNKHIVYRVSRHVPPHPERK